MQDPENHHIFPILAKAGQSSIQYFQSFVWAVFVESLEPTKNAFKSLKIAQNYPKSLEFFQNRPNGLEVAQIGLKKALFEKNRPIFAADTPYDGVNLSIYFQYLQGEPTNTQYKYLQRVKTIFIRDLTRAGRNPDGARTGRMPSRLRVIQVQLHYSLCVRTSHTRPLRLIDYDLSINT